MFALGYLQLSENHVKFYMNCVNKRGIILSAKKYVAENPRKNTGELFTDLFQVRSGC